MLNNFEIIQTFLGISSLFINKFFYNCSTYLLVVIILILLFVIIIIIFIPIKKIFVIKQIGLGGSLFVFVLTLLL